MRLLVVLLVCVISCALAIKRPKYDPNKAQEYFEKFIAKYHKHYNSTERLTRFQIFAANLNIINRLNSFNKGVHAINKFSDLTPMEFEEQTECLDPDDEDEETRLRSWIPIRRRNLCDILKDNDVKAETIPDELDYRDQNVVSSVKNQLECRSCWAFTSAGILEGAYAIKHGELQSLSAQELMDCLQCSGHCHDHGSTMKKALSELKDKTGVMSSEEYPYKGKDENCNYQSEEVKVTVTGCSNFRLQKEENLKVALNEHGPIGIGISTDGLQHYKGSVLSLEECPVNKATHAVLLVGYGTKDGQDYWLIKNSWGTDWGEDGYLLLARGENVCGLMNKHIVIASVD